jgi:DNA repair exonuclease SbcCD ATPase subunit
MDSNNLDEIEQLQPPFQDQPGPSHHDSYSTISPPPSPGREQHIPPRKLRHTSLGRSRRLDHHDDDRSPISPDRWSDRSKTRRALDHLLADDRLTNETTRANTAEKQLAETLATLRTVIEARNKALEDHARTSEELRLWKVQLENARAELNRGQEIIKQLEQDRDQALQNSTRDRGRVRKLLLERAVWNAREEGWAQGYKEGFQVAQMQGTESDVAPPPVCPHRKLGNSDDDEYESDDENHRRRDRDIRSTHRSTTTRSPER